MAQRHRGFLLVRCKIDMSKLPSLQPKLKPARSHTPKSSWGQGRGGRPWRRLRDQVLARDRYTCQICGRVGGKLELDHIINLAQGGTDDPRNLQMLCQSCHQQKTLSESQRGGIQKI